jgi:hypothetical protein
MKRRPAIVAAAAMIALLGVLAGLAVDWGGWSFQLPRIEASPAKRERPVSAVTPAAASTQDALTDRRPPATAGLRSFGDAKKDANPPSTAPQKRRAAPQGQPPYWCFRTFFPGLPWMMSTDERNAGNAAHSDSEYIWNGTLGLRMDYVQIGDAAKQPRSVLSAQRNVLWQAIRAEPFRGKRVAFSPALRAMPGGHISAFLRSWNGSTGAPQLAADRSNPASTPTVMWSAAWGKPRLLLDVPADATILYYGIVQSGARTVWIDHVEITTDSLPAALSPYRDMGYYLEGLPPLPIDPNWTWNKPQNLDFEIIDPDENGEPLPDTPPPSC